MRLPYGVQADEADAQRSLDFIKPDETLVTVDVKPATDAAGRVGPARRGFGDPRGLRDIGNIKARQRMIAQYVVAGARGGLVVGTDHAAEAVMGFFTKYGDGACDLTPLVGADQAPGPRGRAALGRARRDHRQGADGRPGDQQPGPARRGRPGVTYDEIDDFLEGREVDEKAAATIIGTHRRTAHKRALPLAV